MHHNSEESKLAEESGPPLYGRFVQAHRRGYSAYTFDERAGGILYSVHLKRLTSWALGKRRDLARLQVSPVTNGHFAHQQQGDGRPFNGLGWKILKLQPLLYGA